MTTPNLDVPQKSEAGAYYHVSFDRLDRLNRAAVTLLASRRSPMSPSMLLPDHELTDAQELLEEIAEFSRDDDDYIRSELPIQEIVFRTLLLRRNEPISLAELHYQLTEHWSTPVRAINVSVTGLQRILNSDYYYGFEQLEED